MIEKIQTNFIILEVRVNILRFYREKNSTGATQSFSAYHKTSLEEKNDLFYPRVNRKEGRI